MPRRGRDTRETILVRSSGLIVLVETDTILCAFISRARGKGRRGERGPGDGAISEAVEARGSAGVSLHGQRDESSLAEEDEPDRPYHLGAMVTAGRRREKNGKRCVKDVFLQNSRR